MKIEYDYPSHLLGLMRNSLNSKAFQVNIVVVITIFFSIIMILNFSMALSVLKSGMVSNASVTSDSRWILKMGQFMRKMVKMDNAFRIQEV